MLTGLDNEVDEVADVGLVAVLMGCDRFLGLLRLKGSHLPRQLIRKESRVET